MKKLFFAILLIAATAVAAWLNWDRLQPVVGPLVGVQAVPAPVATQEVVTLRVAPPPRARFLEIDPTTSTDASFRQSMKALVVAAVQSYVPPKPRPAGEAVPALAGLQLTVRLVGTNSLASSAPNYAVLIPSVPALPRRPDLRAPHALDPGGAYDVWKKSMGTWSAEYDAARAAQAVAVQRLQAIRLDSAGYSGITSGLAALALLAPANGDVRFAVMSDLDENRPRQPADLHGHPVLVVQPDPVGDIARWDSLFASFSAWASASHAGPITRVRPELAGTAISAFISGT